MKKQALFILNPFSGDIPNKESLAEEIIENMHAYDVFLWKTTGEKDHDKITKLLSEGDYDRLVVGGGDGTIKMVVENYTQGKSKLLIVPFGSANGLATCFGIKTWEESIYCLHADKSIDMDILEINGESCLHLCDFGFNADLIKHFEEGNERGMVAYFKSSLKSFFEIEPYLFSLELGKDVETFQARMLIIANGDKYGTGATINPGAKMDDGLFEIIALNPENLQDWLALTYGIVRKDLSNLPFVKKWQTEEVVINNTGRAPFHIDGEMVETTEKYHVKVKQEKVRMLVHPSMGS
jgi:YegS/Rv2252/BmrU family lipid kinase